MPRLLGKVLALAVLVTAAWTSGVAAQTASDTEAWLGEGPVAETLSQIPSSYPRGRLDKCGEAYGPLSGDHLRLLLEDTSVVYQQFKKPREAYLAADMFDDDRLCLESGASCNRVYYCKRNGPTLVIAPRFGAEIAILAVKRSGPPEGFEDLVTDFIASTITNVVTDSATGCTLGTNWNEVSSFSWSGACVDGQLSGDGVITWYGGKDIVWRTFVGERVGVVAREGQLAFHIDLSQFSFALGSCDTSTSFRSVNITTGGIDDDKFFASGWTQYKVLEIAANYADARCPRPGEKWGNISVNVSSQDGTRVLKARNTSDDSLEWEEKSSVAGQRMSRIVADLNAERQAAERRAAAELRQAELARQFEAAKAQIDDTVAAAIQAKASDPSTLASALEARMIDTVKMMEGGFRLDWPQVTTFATVTDSGKSYASTEIRAVSRYEKLRDEFRQKEGFSWEGFFDATQNPFRGLVTITCLFSDVSQLPQAPRPINGTLAAFNNQGSPASIVLFCS